MIDLQGFEDLIDAMGGITVVSGKRVPISSKVDPSTGQHGPVLGWIEPGEQHLDGYHALWFARSREFASDYERMVRQRCVQDAMVRQLDPSTLLLRFQDIATAAPEVVTTDIPQIQVDRFVDLALKTRSAGTSSLNLTPPEVDPTHPDFAQVHELVASAIAESEESAEAASGPAVPGTGALGEVSVWAAPQAGASPADVSAAGATGEADEGAAEDEDASAICSVP
jgi:hypothetical protein